MKKLSRKEAEDALQTIPLGNLLGAPGALTKRQTEFARQVALGNTKAQAYRTAYNPRPAPSTIVTTPYKVAADPRVQREIEAYSLAIEAAKHRTPLALRELVIQSLVKVIIDPESKAAQITAAAKVLGTVTEVAAFTEQRVVRTISSSEDARAELMRQIRELTTLDATDVSVQADALLAELAGDEPHPPGTPPAAEQESLAHVHTIPPESPHPKPESPSSEPPPPHPQDTPPS